MAVTNGSAHVLYRQSGAVGVITINNPPVNALAKDVRISIAELIDLAQTDKLIKAIVICGAGRNFCGGADIREFNTPNRAVRPMTRHLMNLVEESDKPVVAAIHGPTLGGGLELAMGCHYRIVDSEAKLGLPEVHRGVVPGAGGTQRLPRLVGFRKGLEMITSGTPVDAATALEIGLVDRIVTDADLVARAIAYASKLVEQNVVPRRTSEIEIDLNQKEGEAVVAEVRARLEKSARGMEAPFRCLESVANTLTMSFQDGWAREAEISEEAVASDESRSLVHSFFAERQTSKIPDIPADIPRRKIEKVAILGAGTMGGGIAMSFANAGMDVTVIEASQENLDKGLARIEGNYDVTRKRGRLTDEEMAARMACISGSVDMAAVSEADLVI
ncbi:MAG: enoyl-CoA hydratase-related protein, partial [Alphaproteobacteria bacterium]